jgi:integrase/recombinase XerD
MRTEVLDTDPPDGDDVDPSRGALVPVSPAAAEVIPAKARDTHPVAVYLARLAPGSRRTMRQALDIVAALLTDGRADALTLPWAQLRYQHTQAVRSRLAERYRPATVNKTLAAVRGVLKEAWRLGLMPADDYHRAVDLRGVSSHTLPRGRALSAGEIRALFVACATDHSPAGARDAAMLALLYGAGMRRQEVVRLDFDDVDIATGAVTIHAGKGRKDRIAYTSNGSLAALQAWLTVRGSDPGPLFVPVAKGGKMTVRRMIPHAVYKTVSKRAREAGVKAFSPHDLRRTFVSDLLDAGADVATVQQLAGHAGIATTVKYDRRGEAAKRRAVELLHVPFGG